MTKEEKQEEREKLVKRIALRARQRSRENKIPCMVVNPGQRTRLENGLLGNGKTKVKLNGIPVISDEDIGVVGTYCMPAILEYLEASNLQTREIPPEERHFMEKDCLQKFFNPKKIKEKLGDLLD